LNRNLDSDGKKLVDFESGAGANSENRECRNIGFPVKSSEKSHFKKMLMGRKIRMTEQEIDELIPAPGQK